MEFGHWEMDAVAGGVGTSEAWLMTITERRTRFGITRKIGDRTMRSVAREPDVLERQMGVSLFQGLFKTVTGDNGSEFSDMEGMERSALSPKRRLTLCFSHPYGSFEWGTNGNHNGIIRRFIPKGSDIGICTRSSPRHIERYRQVFRLCHGMSPPSMEKVCCLFGYNRFG